MGGKLKIKVKDAAGGADNPPPVPARKVSVSPAAPKPEDSPKASPKNDAGDSSPAESAEQVEASPKSASAESSPVAKSSEAPEAAEAAPVAAEAAEAAPEAKAATPEEDEKAAKLQAEQTAKDEAKAKKEAEAAAKKQEEADRKEQERLRKEQEKNEREKLKAEKLAQDAQLKAAIDAATDAETKAFLVQSGEYLDDKSAAVAKLNEWNAKILTFFAFQRAPYLQKLNNALARVTNGEQALNEAKDWIKFMSSVHGSASSKLRGVSFFGTDLHKTKNKLPQLPPSGDSDPSVLALSQLTQLSYASHEKHALVVDDLKRISVSVDKLTKNYGTKAQKDIQKMLSQVKDCEDASNDIDKLFHKHVDQFNYYLQAMRAEGSDKTYSKLTSSSRKDMWRTEQVYRERVIALTAQHKVFFQQCTALLEELHKAEQERALKLHTVLQETSNLFVQYYAGMHAVATASHAAVQGAVQTAVTNYQQQREQQQQQQLVLASQASPKRPVGTSATAASNEKLVKPEPPGPFPQNTCVVLAGAVQIEKGFFKKWKKFYLVLTKDHFLHCYSLDDVDTSGENSEIFGPGTGTFSTTKDASKVRFLLREGKSAEGDETWTADAFDATAEPAPKGDTSFLLKVTPAGIFSSNWDAVIKCDSVVERDLWIAAIREHSSPRTKAAHQLQPDQQPAQ
jgi:hypothetical protein